MTHKTVILFAEKIMSFPEYCLLMVVSHTFLALPQVTLQEPQQHRDGERTILPCSSGMESSSSHYIHSIADSFLQGLTEYHSTE